MRAINFKDEIFHSSVRALIEHMQLVAISLTMDGSINYVNPYFTKITGYALEEIQGKDWEKLMHPELELDVKRNFKEIVEKSFKSQYESTLTTKQGKVLSILWNNSLLTTEDGEIIGTLSIGEDITERTEALKSLKLNEENVVKRNEELERINKELEDAKKATLNLLDDATKLQEELEAERDSIELKVAERTKEVFEEKARLLASINSVPHGLIVTDSRGKILLSNQYVSKILETEHLHNWSLEIVQEYLKDAFNIKDAFESCIRTRQPFSEKNIAYISKFLNIYVGPVHLNGEQSEIIGTVIFIEDITEAKVIERAKDEFFSIASHELKTPLTAVKGNVQLLITDYAQKIADPEFNSIVKDVYSSTLRLINIVNDFLTTSKIEQGKMGFKIEEFDANKTIVEVVRMMEAYASSKGLELKFVDTTGSLQVMGDQERFREVLYNLISNSINYTDKGSIVVTTGEESKEALVSVTDTGRGIPQQNQKFLFRKFQQAGASIYAREATQGTGLGLYISKGLVEGMGGKIYLKESVEGKGTTFVFTVPKA